jgi:hypothetical protein
MAGANKARAMSSHRRIRAYGLIITVFILILWYINSGAKHTRSSALYQKTSDAIEKQRLAQLTADKSGVPPDANVYTRVKQVENSAKELADERGHQMQQDIASKDAKPVWSKDSVADGEKSIAGRRKMKDGVAPVGNIDTDTPQATRGGQAKETEEQHEVEVELNSILKMSPSESLHSRHTCSSNSYHRRRVSHYLLQILLPVFQEGEGNNAREIQDSTPTLRSRIGRASFRRTDSSCSW